MGTSRNYYSHATVAPVTGRAAKDDAQSVAVHGVPTRKNTSIWHLFHDTHYDILFRHIIRKVYLLKISLGNKLALLLLVFTVGLSGVALVVGLRVVDDMNSQHYTNRANEIAATVASIIDADDAAKLVDQTKAIYSASSEHVLSDEWGTPEFDAYVGRYAHLTEQPEFATLLTQLRTLQDVNDVDCLYLAFVIPEDEAFVYLVDAAEEEPCPPGCVDPVYEVNRAVLTEPEVGFPAYITDTPEYGWLVTAGVPVHDSNGNVVCYAFDDISMDAIKQRQQNRFINLAVGTLSLAAILGVVAYWYVKRSIVRPLDELSEAAARYCTPEEGQRSTFEDLSIHTRDEIESLHKSMIQMEHDIDGYIENLVNTKTQLRDTRIEANLMSDLAHKDALTGLASKLSYDQEMEHLDDLAKTGDAVYGLVVIDLNDLKNTNDLYGHDCGNVSLKRLSELIQSVFSDSPVYRIGGDEFVVLLTGEVYGQAQELVHTFEAAIAEIAQTKGIEPWERISAAIGYALYDSVVDTNTNGVFHRADAQMYENKRRMKGDRGVR